jgi:hypothetical protein
VIVNDLYRIRTFVSPKEADSVPLVDADAMLTFPISSERLKSVPWRNLQFNQAFY